MRAVNLTRCFTHTFAEGCRDAVLRVILLNCKHTGTCERPARHAEFLRNPRR